MKMGIVEELTAARYAMIPPSQLSPVQITHQKRATPLGTAYRRNSSALQLFPRVVSLEKSQEKIHTPTNRFWYGIVICKIIFWSFSSLTTFSIFTCESEERPKGAMVFLGWTVALLKQVPKGAERGLYAGKGIMHGVKVTFSNKK